MWLTRNETIEQSEKQVDESNSAWLMPYKCPPIVYRYSINGVVVFKSRYIIVLLEFINNIQQLNVCKKSIWFYKQRKTKNLRIFGRRKRERPQRMNHSLYFPMEFVFLNVHIEIASNLDWKSVKFDILVKNCDGYQLMDLRFFFGESKNQSFKNDLVARWTLC